MYQIGPAIPEKIFLTGRRDLMLGYPGYVDIFDDCVETFQVVGRSLSNAAVLTTLSIDKPMIASEQRATDAVSYLHLQYSAGVAVAALSNFLPPVIAYWETYSDYHARFHMTPASSHVVAHLTLQDEGYWHAIRLTSFAILLGHTDTLHRLCSIWDYGDQPLDGLLERLVAPYVPGRAPPPDTCTKHLPYFKLLKVFAADAEKRPALMAKYMDDWYEASRREPYYRSHTKGREHSYLGYWSFEAAAATIVLDIDDSSYRDKDFYPRDLTDFARASVAARGTAEAATPADAFMRCEAGQPCPRTGWWFTPAVANSRRHFQQGETMPDLKSAWGDTIWQWDHAQD